MLYGRSNEPTPNQTAREGYDGATHPQKRRDGDGPLTPEAMTINSTLETKADRRKPRASNERWDDAPMSARRRRAVARERWMPRNRRRRDPHDPNARSSLMFLFFARCRARDRTPQTCPNARHMPRRAKLAADAMNTKKP